MAEPDNIELPSPVVETSPSINPAAKDEYGLTRKQRIMCDTYLADPMRSKRKAYIAAGYSTKTEKSIQTGVPEKFRSPRVKKYLLLKQRKLEQRNDLETDRIVQEYLAAALFDPAMLFDEDGHLLPVTEMPESARRAISQIDVFTQFEGKGKDKTPVGLTTRLRFVDKKGSLDSISRIMGLFQQDRMNTDTIDALMRLVSANKEGTTIGSINGRTSESRQRNTGDPDVEIAQLVLHPGQEGQQGPLQAQLGADGPAEEFLVHEHDTESSSVGDDDLPGYFAP